MMKVKSLPEKKVEIVGGSLTAKEQSLLEKYLDRDTETSVGTSKKRIAKLFETVKTKYPGASKPLDQILDSLDENYDKISFSAAEIGPGDLCRNLTYLVSIPEHDIMKRLLSKEIEQNKEKTAIERLFGYPAAIYNIPNLFDGLGKESDKAMDVVWGRLYDDKIINLQDILTRDLPAVCFEKALVLNYLLSNDPEIKRLGGRSTVGNGYILEDKDDFCEHAWVVLAFPKIYPDQGINSETYILDASINKVFEYKQSETSTAFRYVKDSDEKLLSEGSFVVLRPKTQTKSKIF